MAGVSAALKTAEFFLFQDVRFGLKADLRCGAPDSDCQIPSF